MCADLAPARLEIDLDLNEMVLTQEMAVVLQWKDTRLDTSACRAALSSMLSMSREEANSDLQRNVKAPPCTPIHIVVPFGSVTLTLPLVETLHPSRIDLALSLIFPPSVTPSYTRTPPCLA